MEGGRGRMDRQTRGKGVGAQGMRWAGALEASGRSRRSVVGDRVGEPGRCRYKTRHSGSEGLRALQTQHRVLDRTLLLGQRNRPSNHLSCMGFNADQLPSSHLDPQCSSARLQSQRRGGAPTAGPNGGPEASRSPTSKDQCPGVGSSTKPPGPSAL